MGKGRKSGKRRFPKRLWNARALNRYWHRHREASIKARRAAESRRAERELAERQRRSAAQAEARNFRQQEVLRERITKLREDYRFAEADRVRDQLLALQRA